MPHKWMAIFITLVLFSLLIAPLGTANAARAHVGEGAQDVPPDCPTYEPDLLQDRDFLRSLPVECIQAYKELTRQAHPLEEADSQTTDVFGPDVFGYTSDDTVPYNWISATTDSGLTGYNQFTGPIDIGFSFPFYGMPQSQLYFNTNGLITFGAGSGDPGSYANALEVNPNNLIAPYWDYLVVGSPYNSGAIYYAKGGTAPNRYFAVEWRNVTLDYGSSKVPFTFEAILYENGDIVFQYQSLPGYWPNFIGIEDSVGYYRLNYSGEFLEASKAIRFYYPTTSTARLFVSPVLQTGGFAPLNGYKDFPIKVINPGTLGADRYDLSPASAWPVTFYASNGLTPLTDTDGDSLIDTGPLAQGTAATVIARVATPNGAQVGDSNIAAITITSSLNASKTKTIYLLTSIPVRFVSVFQDEANGAMSLMTSGPSGTSTSKATPNGYFGSEVAVTPLSGDTYFYAWSRRYFDGSHWTEDIEYALLSSTGEIIRPVTTLTNDVTASILTVDWSPSVAMAPDGTIGVAWVRQRNDTTNGKFNYNIYFATLNRSGTPLTGPTDITNNTAWTTISDPVITRFRNPTLAASDDNRFVIGWNRYLRDYDLGSHFDIWYAIRNTVGANVYSPHALTGDHISYEPILNSLAGGKVIMTWHTYDWSDYLPNYAVINSTGSLVSLPAYDFGRGTESSPDAVQLPNGKVAIAWPTFTGVRYVILNSSFIFEASKSASTPAPIPGDLLSVTTDAASHVIMTWVSGEASNVSYYALGDSAGVMITPPMIYKTSGHFVDVSANGQGNAPYVEDAPVEGDPIAVTIGGGLRGTYTLSSGESRRVSFTGLDKGPVKIESTNDVPFMSAERVIYKVNNVPTSFSEMMALPNSQLDTTYWLPWYNNKDLNTQLRFANVSDTTATIHVSIGGTPVTGSPFLLAPGASTRKSFAGIDKGPVKIESDVNIIAAERVIYNANGVDTSFSEMMALPANQLDNVYWLPWYNNKDLDTQLRIANVSTSDAAVHVSIGGTPVTGSPFTILAGKSIRKSFPGIDQGPVKIESNVNIVAAERVIYKMNTIPLSFSETMALPDSQVDTIYWMPWYNSKDLNTQLRIANVSLSEATVHVRIGGVEVAGSPFTIPSGGSKRLSFAGIDKGPVQIESNVDIVAAERVIYTVNGKPTSFSEMMGLPNGLLDSLYWLPWYNNKDLDTQLRFGVP